jgi:hypothetical protein
MVFPKKILVVVSLFIFYSFFVGDIHVICVFVIIFLLLELLSYVYICCLIKNSFVGPTVMYAIYLKFQMDVFMSKIINMP